MFGLGKIFSGVLDKFGLGWLGSAISIGVNLMSGNWFALIGDVSNLVSQFKGFSFLEKFNRFAPLGGFGFNGGGCFSNNLSLGLGRADSLLDSIKSTGGLNKALSMVQLVRETERNISIFNTRNSQAMHNYRLC